MKFKAFYSLVLIASTAALFTTLPSRYHLPNSAVESALDSFLRISSAVDDKSLALRDYITKAPDAKHTHDKEFDKQISRELRDAVATIEAKEVQKNCNGHYIKGELCGLDIDPITCSQDPPEAYVYRSEIISPNETIIRARAHNNINNESLYERIFSLREDMATYRLVFIDHAWKVDGIRCDGERDFSMHYYLE
jgi:hypothetical protein